MSIFNSYPKHVKSFTQYIAEEYDPILRSDTDPQAVVDPDFEDVDDMPGDSEEIEEDILDREYAEPSYLDDYQVEDDVDIE